MSRNKKFMAGLAASVMLFFSISPCLHSVVPVLELTVAAEDADYTEGNYDVLTYRNYGNYVAITDCDENAKSVDIPNEIDGVPVTTVKAYTFNHCSEVTTISIPANLEVIERGWVQGGPFQYSTSLCNFNVSVDNPYFSSEDGVLFNKDMTTLIAFPIAKEAEVYEIPESVLELHAEAFYGSTSMKSVIIPEGITEISNCAFMEATGLKSVTLPESLSRISGRAFYGCTALISVEFPQTLSIICGEAFENCTSLTSVYIPKVGEIIYYAFGGCTSLEKVEILEGITAVEKYVFYGCTSLQEVSLPISVRTIETNAFARCTSLSRLTISTYVETIEPGAFAGCSSLSTLEIAEDNLNFEMFECLLLDKNEPGRLLTYLPGNAQTEYTLPDYITVVSEKSFKDCVSLEQIIIPETVTIIEAQAFKGCTNLDKISIYNPDCEIYPSDDTIEYGTIYGYENSTAETFAFNHIREFGLIGTEYDEGEVESNDPYDIVNNYIEKYVINAATTEEKLNKIYSFVNRYPDVQGSYNTMVAMINNHGGDCYAHSDTFVYMCEKVGFRARIQYAGTYLYDESSNYNHVNTIIEADGNYYSVDYGGIGINLIASAEDFIPYEYEILEDDTVRITEYSSLKKIVIPDMVKSVGSYAFYDCINLAEVSLPKHITGIAESTFELCTNLKQITIPDKVTSIGDYAFYKCGKLKEIIIPDSVTEIGIDVFTETLWLKQLLADTAFFSINNFLVTASPELCIGNITIPEGITEIGDKAFINCTKLMSVSLPASLTSIGDYAFYGCSALTEVTIPDNVTSLGTAAFYNCVLLEKAVLPASITEISSHTFRGCSVLKEIIIPSGVISIGQAAFYECVSLEKVVIPTTVTKMGSHTFLGCTSLTEITLPNSLSGIAGYVFYGCTSLKEITIPKSIIRINEFAFACCDELTDVYYMDSESEWKEISISRGNTPLTSATIHFNFTPPHGDVNMDGSFNIADVVLLQKWLLAVPDVKLADWKAADMNEDGRLDVFDLCLMKRMLVENTLITVVAGSGDVNGDGKFTVADVMLLQKWLLAIPKETLNKCHY